MAQHLDDLHDWFWRRLASRARAPKNGIVEFQEPKTERLLEADICIVTYCGFPGGNAVTTITEAQTFRDAGYDVAIVNCSIKKSRWKWGWVSERYLAVSDLMYLGHRLRRISCRTAIIRGPRMVTTRNFERLAKKMCPERAIFVINNSAYNEDGSAIFSWADLHERIGALGWPAVEICPTGPIIRAECLREMPAEEIDLSDRDWPPVIDASAFQFTPRSQLSEPIVIGRHARDHPGKWLDERAELLRVYPDNDPSIRVSILGGAETVDRDLGGIPCTWSVAPFGLNSVQDYLSTLDIFVNFPSPSRHEAFGRTIIEAILSGLPVILPSRFEATFGELAFYCAPQEVRNLIGKIAADDPGRMVFLQRAKEVATDLFCSPSLLLRLDARTQNQKPVLDGAAARWRQTILSSL
ncbi:glycosyltransferase family 1 protein [Notoacmeibacter ruber]|uniref:Glycosyltransferase family 1 protein n=1 Tax=Notoacmeibacter ruber TaxID=2670375 RepID=A0A3L7J3B5_9HYPH|nr:glycosyltransferase family 1 protein [Notoacmeibacter ruber]RLQ84994.1 glycosyltransferase family 1 protein [Notoacmeibacter ruber]